VRQELSRLADGKRSFTTETIRGTQRDAEKRRAEMIAAGAAAPGVVPSKATLAAHIEEWIAARLAMGKITARTAEGNRATLKTMVRPFPIGARQISALMPAEIARHMVALAPRYSPRTMHHLRSLLRASLASALRERRITFNAADLVEAPRQDTAPPRAFTEGEIKRLLDAAVGDPQQNMILLALHTGLRRGELGALAWADIDLGGGALTVSHAVQKIVGEQSLKGPKSAAGLRRVPLAPAMIDMLAGMRVEAARVALASGTQLESMHVFLGRRGGLSNLTTFSAAFSRIAAKAGIEGGRLHDLRHTHISHALRAGVPLALVTKRAGHSSSAVTVGVYTHALASDRDVVVDPFAATAAKG
jgi:integrase